MKRREFLQTTAATAAGILSLPVAASPAKIKGQLGLQLYTLRDTIQTDPKGVIQKVAEFGYKELETFGYRDGQIYGMPFADFGTFVKDLGMKIVSGHYGLDQAKSDSWDQAISDAKAIGQEYMVVPYLVDSDRKSLDDYKKVCEHLNKAGEACRKQGIRFGYHNHAFEFDVMEGQKPFELMLAELDPKYVGIELDIYWVVRAGGEPVSYFEKYPGRFEQWHVKDMDKTNKDRNADIGKGTIDYKAIFARAKRAGMKHWYVEQESYPGLPIDSVAASAEYLKTLL
jgi:sugar phosphate isomerase/epimerase